MEEAGAQVVAPTVIHPTQPARFCDSYPAAKKRGLPFHSSSYGHLNASDNWNPKYWDWDSSRFVAKPSQCDRSGEDDETLRLKLGRGDGTGNSGNSGVVNLVEPQPVSRPSKRVRSGSPGGADYPVCQVDNCKENLSTSKDYHRRHKVCESHSKAGKALVGKQMQRFCQQCSRFHALSEFDEGKRSCRRRLAGHNRRRRKTQPEDSTPHSLGRASCENNVGDIDIINLLAMLTRAQGITEERSGKFSVLPDKYQLIQILSKMNSLPLPANLAAKLKGSIPNLISSEKHNQMNQNASSPSTIDLLAVLLGTPGARAPTFHAFENQSKPSGEGSDSEKSKSQYIDQTVCLNLHRGPIREFSTVGGERIRTSYHTPMKVHSNVQETFPGVPLQLFSSSHEDHRSAELPSNRNFLSSGSSNPLEERSPLSSPPIVHDLFPLRTSRETMNDDHLSNGAGEIACVRATISNSSGTSLQLFRGLTHANENGSIHSSPCQTRYACSLGSDHSASSLSSDAQDRTGRISFKLFDKDPSHLPGSLRTQIFNWLSSSPSEMESYIRPGCIILSVYLSMPSFAWDQLEENFLNYVNSLVKDIDVDFWGKGRFLVHTDRQMASQKDGKIRLCKSWRAWSRPELISVSPVAVVGEQETSLLLRGRGLTAPGTKIHCTHAAEYNIMEVPLSLDQDSAYDEISLSGFKISGSASGKLGRCFIEVENSFRGTSFPLIIADETICQELRLLEPEMYGTAELFNGIPPDHFQNTGSPTSREVVLHFLDELGWLLQRMHHKSLLFETPNYRLTRFKFLLMFSVEHDFCALVKTLLDFLIELNLGRNGLVRESLEMLSEIHLLNRAVKRRCHSMVDLLLHYSVVDSTDTSENFIFVPNMTGPGGVTPLHLAACTSSSDDMIDALTSDPQEVGLRSWNTVLDANGLSPYAYALMRNNHSYNALVARKLADRKNRQVSLAIGHEIEQFQVEADENKSTISHFNQKQRSCSRCAVAACGYSKMYPGSNGLIRHPYIHSMLVVAAVCVCVCVFLRGHPFVGRASPFKWDNLGYGPI